jgi:hypothetical protein
MNQVFMSSQSPRVELRPIAYIVAKGDEQERFHSWRELTSECREWHGVSDFLNAMFHSDVSCGNITKDVSLFSWQYDNIELALNECGWTVRKVY